MPRKARAAPGFHPSLFLAKVGAGKTVREYRSKAVVYAQGDVADAVYYVERGKVKLTVVSTRGREAVIAILERGTFFGEGCLAGQPLRMSTANAMPAATVVRVDKETTVRLLHQEPEFAELFIAYLLSRNVRIEEDLVDQLFNSSEKRLARTLLLLARYGKQDKPVRVVPKISQETLAEMIGTTRSRVNFFLNKFKKLGFIEYDGDLPIKINNSLLSVVLHD